MAADRFATTLDKLGGTMDFQLAMTAFQSTFGLVLIFMVIFPALVTGLIVFALAQTAGEVEENRSYDERDKSELR